MPTQKDIPVYILQIAGMSLVIFLLAVGIIGTIFGSFFAHGLADRFKQISMTTDRWSSGDFSLYIDDPTGDEITSFSQRLNKMAQQLQSLLRRRQEMAISEERNRLARDLHDSAKQQALAASFELGTALTLYEREPKKAKQHLQAADALVDSVRKELTTLVDELRPLPSDGHQLGDHLKEYATNWAQRNGIALDMHIEDIETFPEENRETLFRILQEALANVARHSAASNTEILVKRDKNIVTMVIKDNGCGFDAQAKQSGLGLSSMRQRAEELGGLFEIQSQPGQGTQVKVTLPGAG
jgi:NarL family two-component system sensor histidine kinase LiaS